MDSHSLTFTLFRRLAVAILFTAPLALASGEENELEIVQKSAAEQVEASFGAVEETASDTRDDAAVAENASGEKSEEKSPEELEAEEKDAEIKRLRRERDLLSIRNSIRSEQVKAELAAMNEEKSRLALENALFREQVQAELLEQQGEMQRVSAEVDAINKQIALEGARMRMELQTELAELNKEQERLEAELSTLQKQNAVEIEQLRIAEMKLKLRRSEMETEYAELQARLSIMEKKEEIGDLAYQQEERPGIYLEDPVVDGVLHISDRRIALNGPIWAGTASHVSERINFFNNQSTEHPIFIVIDSSPGGSIWAGYRILKAMEGSKAPVHVVVKSYAASMAAIITTLAEHSYAYPNAIILHHELSWYGVVGNLSQQNEFAQEAAEWWRRIATPVAGKMGISLDEFRTLMYEKSSSGDWQEFADVAQRYNWVDEIVEKMWETSIDKNPDRYGAQFWAMDGVEEKRDENGKTYVELPRLEPYDFYFLYDPQDYYRIPR